jgi:hypothetical protein
MSSIQITDVSTFKNSTWTKEKLFSPFAKDLVLAMDFDLSADIAATSGVQLTINFEVIEFRTNKVVYFSSNEWNLPQGWQYLYYISGPFVPQDMGLEWFAADIFGLRTSVEAAYWNGPNGLAAFDCLAVSDISWFRLEDLATL